MRGVCWGAVLLLAAGMAHAQEGDEAALALADHTTQAVATASVCRGFVEGALDAAEGEAEVPGGAGGRISADVRCEPSLGAHWRAVLADRMDGVWQQGARGQAVNTLKEVYLSGQSGPGWLLDLGRINVRQGVALGYNPTDWFRTDAVRQVVSPDPTSLRENRQGSVMARGQALWSGGSLTAMISPRFAVHPNDSGFSPDFGATNYATRWELALSQTLAPDLAPQLLLFGAQHQSLQVGLNFTRLLGNATVLYLEASSGRSAALLDQVGSPWDLALAQVAGGIGAASTVAGARMRLATRLATGFTYTTATKVSMTLEYEYNGAAPDARGWSSLRDPALTQLARYAAYREFAAALSDLPTRQGVFAYASWTDAFIANLDLTGFARVDLDDGSRMLWASVDYHWPRTELSLQWQHQAGGITSDLQAGRPRQLWQLVGTFYP